MVRQLRIAMRCTSHVCALVFIHRNVSDAGSIEQPSHVLLVVGICEQTCIVPLNDQDVSGTRWWIIRDVTSDAVVFGLTTVLLLACNPEHFFL